MHDFRQRLILRVQIYKIIWIKKPGLEDILKT